ncbi:MAG: hypothetical protein AAGD25_35410, partial [Cyanobacteria bacterium P01_F01_bin.150]
MSSLNTPFSLSQQINYGHQAQFVQTPVIFSVDDAFVSGRKYWDHLGQPNALPGVPTRFGTNPLTSTQYPDLPPFDLSQPTPRPKPALNPGTAAGTQIGAALATQEALRVGGDVINGRNPFATQGPLEVVGRLVGAGVGWSLGSQAGTYVGAAAGSLTASPVGTAVGGSIGNGVGGTLGAAGGQYLLGWVGQKLDSVFFRPGEPHDNYDPRKLQVQYLMEQGLTGQMPLEEMVRGLEPIMPPGTLNDFLEDFADEAEQRFQPVDDDTGDGTNDGTDDGFQIPPNVPPYDPPPDPPEEPGYYDVTIRFKVYKLSTPDTFELVESIESKF